MSIRRVVCGLSGGVDSAVSAYLLKQKGFSVTGVFMTNWDMKDEGSACTLDRDRADAEHVCRHLGIPFREVNFVKEYWTEVFERLVSFYERGMTPNPDILCNKFVKFEAFSSFARERLGAEAIATGHYARTSFGSFLEGRGSAAECRLLRAADPVKDQTFWLSQVPQRSLENVMFPLGDLLKPQVKSLAREIGLGRIAERPESFFAKHKAPKVSLPLDNMRRQSIFYNHKAPKMLLPPKPGSNQSMGICFIGKRNFRAFIDEYVPPRLGVFRHCETQAVMGHHDGVHHFTLGQRSHIRGLSCPFFVSSLNPETQEVGVAPTTNHPALFSDTLMTGPAHWIGAALPELLKTGRATCEFRWQNRWRPVTCELALAPEGGLQVTLAQPMRALSPGQYAVFYRGDVCLGSALILSSRSLFEDGHRDSVPWNIEDFLVNYSYPQERS